MDVILARRKLAAKRRLKADREWMAAEVAYLVAVDGNDDAAEAEADAADSSSQEVAVKTAVKKRPASKTDAEKPQKKKAAVETAEEKKQRKQRQPPDDWKCKGNVETGEPCATDNATPFHKQIKHNKKLRWTCRPCRLCFEKVRRKAAAAEKGEKKKEPKKKEKDEEDVEEEVVEEEEEAPLEMEVEAE
jgi:hypothetical protein